MTPAQKKVYDAIKEFWAVNGYSPSYRALAEMLESNSFSGIHRIARCLKDEGWITLRDGKARSICLVEGNKQPSCTQE